MLALKPDQRLAGWIAKEPRCRLVGLDGAAAMEVEAPSARFSGEWRWVRSTLSPQFSGEPRKARGLRLSLQRRRRRRAMTRARCSLRRRADGSPLPAPRSQHHPLRRPYQPQPRLCRATPAELDARRRPAVSTLAPSDCCDRCPCSPTCPSPPEGRHQCSVSAFVHGGPKICVSAPTTTSGPMKNS